MSLLTTRPASGARAVRGTRRLMAALARDEHRLTLVLTRRLTPLFASLGQDAGRAYRALKAGGDETTVLSILSALRVLDWRYDRLRPELETHYLRVVAQTGDTVTTVLGVATSIPDVVAREIVADGGRRAGLIDLDSQTRDALFRALADGRAAGEGPAALATRIEGYVAGGRFHEPGTRARLIARTETKHAQNASSLAAYRQSDAVTGVIAYDNRIGYDDGDCSARDGQFFTFDDAAAETEDEHPNGTLSWGPATGGDE